MKALLIGIVSLLLSGCNWWVPSGPMLFWCETQDLCDAVNVAVKQIRPHYPWDIAVVNPDMMHPTDQDWNRWYVYRFSGEREGLTYCGKDHKDTNGGSDRDDQEIIIGECVTKELLTHAVVHEVGHAFGLEHIEDDPVMRSTQGKKYKATTFGEKARAKLRSFW